MVSAAGQGMRPTDVQSSCSVALLPAGLKNHCKQQPHRCLPCMPRQPSKHKHQPRSCLLCLEDLQLM